MSNTPGKLLAGLLLIALSSFGHAAIWRDAPTVSARNTVKAVRTADYGRQLLADETALRDLLATATSTSPAILSLPMPEGGLRRFSVTPSPVMSPTLAAEFPSIQTFRARALDDTAIGGRLSIGPKGFRAYISDVDDAILIDPAATVSANQYVAYRYRSYQRTFAAKRQQFQCHSKAGGKSQRSSSLLARFGSGQSVRQAKTEGGLTRFRLAMAATYEYSQVAGGGDKTLVMDEMVAAVNRVNEIYQRDLGIELELVSALIYSASEGYTASTDPYSNGNPDIILDQNQTVMDATPGGAGYDIGHVLGTGGGGLAHYASACDTANKAKGYSGAPTGSPTGDGFFVDYLAHELGHQFSASHSFNSTSGSCAENRNYFTPTAFEPGSGVTIMGYAGLCDPENVANDSIATFHAGSIEEITQFVQTGGGACFTSSGSQSNTAPAVNAGADYAIPGGTPFVLTGSASDAETGLLYSWEEVDSGVATNALSYGLDVGSNPLFRSYLPTLDNSRMFPALATLLSGAQDKAEVLPTQSRDLNFRLTVRDGIGGVDADDMVLTVDGSKGPFRVIQPAASQILSYTQTQRIEWNRACTDQPPVNCAQVDISYTVDDGQTFNTIVQATANDGAEDIQFSAVPGFPQNNSNVRIRIACSNNVFFALSDAFVVTSVGGTSLTASNTAESCGTEQDYTTANGMDVEPNDTVTNAQSVSIPFTITGSIHELADPDDLYLFESVGGAYEISLADFQPNDLDLYLYDASTGELVAESADFIGTTESIRLGLARNRSYFVRVNGYLTGGVASSYSLSITRSAPVISSSGGGGWAVWLLCLAPVFGLRGFSRLASTN